MRSSSFALVAVLSLTGCAAGSPGITDGGSQTPATVDLDAISEEKLLERVTYLADDALAGRDEGTAGGIAAREYIIAAFESCGLEGAGTAGFEQPITTGQGANVLARLPGTDDALRGHPVIISAHYDHIGACDGAICNGAYDNAAGVSALIALACAYAAAPPPRTLLFAAWDAEEPPAFLTERMGSEFFATNPTLPLPDIAVILVLDLVGAELWPGWMGHTILGSELSEEVATALAAAPVPEGLDALTGGLHLVEQTPFGRQPWSDYHAFRERGVPVLFFSDGQNKRYHTPDDEVAALNIPKLALETRYLLDIVGELSRAQEQPKFQANGADYENDARMVTQALEAALDDGGLVDGLALSSQARSALEADLQAALGARATLEGGDALTTQQVSALRRATQRIMCLAGPLYTEPVCNSL